MKKEKVKDFKIDKIPCDMCTYVLKIKHDYPITQFYRTMDRFVDKLSDYSDFDIKETILDKKTKTYTMRIEGKLPVKDSKKIGRPRKEI